MLQEKQCATSCQHQHASNSGLKMFKINQLAVIWSCGHVICTNSVLAAKVSVWEWWTEARQDLGWTSAKIHQQCRLRILSRLALFGRHFWLDWSCSQRAMRVRQKITAVRNGKHLWLLCINQQPNGNQILKLCHRFRDHTSIVNMSHPSSS